MGSPVEGGRSSQMRRAGATIYNGEDVTGPRETGVIPLPPSVVIHNQLTNAPLDLPSWATDASRPSGPDANKLDPRINRTPNGLTQDAMTFIALGQQYPQMGRGDQGEKSGHPAPPSTPRSARSPPKPGMDVPQLRALVQGEQRDAHKAARQLRFGAGLHQHRRQERRAAKCPDSEKFPMSPGVPGVQQTIPGNRQKMVRECGYVAVRNIPRFGAVRIRPHHQSANADWRPLPDSARQRSAAAAGSQCHLRAAGRVPASAAPNEGGNRLQSIGDQIRTIRRTGCQHSSEAGQMGSGQQAAARNRSDTAARSDAARHRHVAERQGLLVSHAGRSRCRGRTREGRRALEINARPADAR